MLIMFTSARGSMREPGGRLTLSVSYCSKKSVRLSKVNSPLMPLRT